MIWPIIYLPLSGAFISFGTIKEPVLGNISIYLYHLLYVPLLELFLCPLSFEEVP
jgi:hypothetical protein